MFCKNRHQGLSLYGSGKLFLVAIPFLFYYTNAKNINELEQLMFGERWGFQMRLFHQEFFFGKRIYYFTQNWRDLFGTVEQAEFLLDDPITLRTGDGVFVMQKKKIVYKRKWWPFPTDQELGYQVLSSPFDLGSADFFTRGDPLKIAVECRQVAEAVKELREQIGRGFP